MGRRKQYQRETLVAAAQQLFHEHGYAATTTQMLVDHLAINRNTLYTEFGSKQELFDAVLQAYDASVAATLFEGLGQATSGLEAIADLFDQFAASAGDAAGLGCLLCNTAVELRGDEAGSGPHVQRYLERMQRAFALALSRARDAGALAETVDVASEAAFLASACLGIFVMVRARAATDGIRAAARAAKRHVDSLRAGDSWHAGVASDR